MVLDGSVPGQNQGTGTPSQISAFRSGKSDEWLTDRMSRLHPDKSFSRLFGTQPEWVIQSPGRINLIGEHVDYLEGFVMPAAIDRSIRMTAARNGKDEIRVWTGTLKEGPPARIDLTELSPFSGSDFWLNYIAGVVEMLRREGLEPVGFDATISADLPTGAGLSSSAALETATALAVESLAGTSLDPGKRAKLCQKAEHEFAGVPCGLMDQLAVGLGREDHALLIDCRDQSVTPVPIPPGIAILVSDTKVKHALADGEYRERRNGCEEALAIIGKPGWRHVTLSDLDTCGKPLDNRLYRRSRHVVTEMERVTAMATALRSKNFDEIGAIMKSGHESLRDDFEVSCQELDLLVSAAYEFGAESGHIGSRMTGGGFGGSTISLVREEAATSLKHHLEKEFRAGFGRDANCFITRASCGARAEPVL
jgi:galactokinase